MCAAMHKYTFSSLVERGRMAYSNSTTCCGRVLSSGLERDADKVYASDLTRLASLVTSKAQGDRGWEGCQERNVVGGYQA